MTKSYYQKALNYFGLNSINETQSSATSNSKPCHSIYRGMALKDVQDRFVNDYGNDIHLWICTDEEEFCQENYAHNTLRLLVVNGTVIDTSYG